MTGGWLNIGATRIGNIVLGDDYLPNTCEKSLEQKKQC